MRNTLSTLLMVLFLIGCSRTNKSDNLSVKDETIETIVAELTIDAITDEEKIEQIYYFVRDEITFGWVYPQDIPVEEVLKKRRGVCMQKTNLLVAMAREAGLKARFHFMYVHKKALEDFLPEYAYTKWVDPFPHAFPEILINGKWVSMEATFDKELHEICIKKKINFGKNESIVNNISIEFSIHGVKGHQQYLHSEGINSFYSDDLSVFTKYLHNDVPWFKRMMQPVIFKQADRIMDQLRNEE